MRGDTRRGNRPAARDAAPRRPRPRGARDAAAAPGQQRPAPLPPAPPQASLPSLCQKKCAVHVDLSEHGMGVPGATAAGAVQEALVRALERCPAEGPVVWLHHALRAHPEVLRGPVHTLTGESGVFHHMGRAVRADRALVFLTVESPDATEADVKSALMGLADGVEGKGLALVRRIDHFVALQ